MMRDAQLDVARAAGKAAGEKGWPRAANPYAAAAPGRRGTYDAKLDDAWDQGWLGAGVLIRTVPMFGPCVAVSDIKGAVRARSGRVGVSPDVRLHACGRKMRRCDNCGGWVCNAPGHAPHICAGGAAHG